MKWLNRLREKNALPSPAALTKLTEGHSVRSAEAFVSFVSAPPVGTEVFLEPQTSSSELPRPDTMPPADAIGEPCPACGSHERWRWLDGRLICRPCLIAGDAPPVAVKVFSPILDEGVWVVADGLPREAWPTDAPVYTQAEVKILQRLGTDTLAWVHATKTMFGAKVVDGGRRPAAAPDTIGEEVNDG